MDTHTHTNTPAQSRTASRGRLPIVSNTRPESEHHWAGGICVCSLLCSLRVSPETHAMSRCPLTCLGNHFSLLSSHSFRKQRCTSNAIACPDPCALVPPTGGLWASLLDSYMPFFCSSLTRPHSQSRGLHQPAPPEVGWRGELLPGPQRAQHLFPHQRAACAGDVWEFQHRWALLPCGELFSRCQVSYGHDLMKSSYYSTSHHSYELGSIISFSALAP